MRARARAKEHFPSLFSFFFPPLSILRHSPLTEQLVQATNSQKKLETIAIKNCLKGVRLTCNFDGLLPAVIP